MQLLSSACQHHYCLLKQPDCMLLIIHVALFSFHVLIKLTHFIHDMYMFYLKQIKSLFARMDKDKNGTISFNEFLEKLRVSSLIHSTSHH